MLRDVSLILIIRIYIKIQLAALKKTLKYLDFYTTSHSLPSTGSGVEYRGRLAKFNNTELFRFGLVQFEAV